MNVTGQPSGDAVPHQMPRGSSLGESLPQLPSFCTGCRCEVWPVTSHLGTRKQTREVNMLRTVELNDETDLDLGHVVEPPIQPAAQDILLWENQEPSFI